MKNRANGKVSFNTCDGCKTEKQMTKEKQTEEEMEKETELAMERNSRKEILADTRTASR